jgi:hypothetical protein
MLSDEMKAERVRISREILERFEKESEDFLNKNITGDKTWVHPYDPEKKALWPGNEYSTDSHNHQARVANSWPPDVVTRISGGAALRSLILVTCSFFVRTVCPCLRTEVYTPVNKFGLR